MHRVPLIALFALAWNALPAEPAAIFDPGQGAVLLPPGPEAAGELSDIAHLPTGGYLLVSDDTAGGARTFTAAIVLDTATGTIVGTPSIDGSVILAAGADTEGLALSGTDRFFVSDEVGPAIREHDAAGAVTNTVAIPEVFTAGVRANFGFEALSEEEIWIPRSSGDIGGGLWTVNEEALTSDGPVSSFTDGTIVRIQRFDDLLLASGQWGYVTDAIQGDIIGSGTGRDVERSGVVELAVLPDGTVLALERALGGVPLPQFRSRIYELNFDDATDTTDEANLTIGSFVPVEKTLLWEGIFDFGGGLPNYEGMALGPVLDNGDLSLILVSDDNGGSSEQSLYALRVTDFTIAVPPSISEADPALRVLRNPAREIAHFVVDLTSGDVVEIFGLNGTRVETIRVDPSGRASWRPAHAVPGMYWARVRGADDRAIEILLLR